MSRENVEIVRACLDAFNKGDMDAALKDLAPSFEFDFSRSIGLQRGVYGLDQMRRFLGDIADLWKSARFDAEFIEAGEQVVTLSTTSFTGREGIEVQARGSMVWTIRDARIERLCFYQEQHEGLEAVGLEAQSE